MASDYKKQNPIIAAGLSNKYNKYQSDRYTFTTYPTIAMKLRKAYLLSFLLVIFACTSDDGRTNNPFLVDIGFQIDLNTNLPQFGNLNFDLNFVTVPDTGLRGIIVYRISSTQYVAYELSDPNHSPNSCSRMSISGIEATCPCPDDQNKYNVITGQPIQGDGRYGLKAYRAERIGEVVRVTN
jgi:hypothetical protein